MRKLREHLIRDEANRLKPYLDCCGKYWRLCTCQDKGKLTIGVGRNLDDVGISAQESAYLLDNDLAKVIAQCRGNFPWFDALDPVRQEVVVNMVFNLGLTRFMGFVNTIKLIESGQFKQAASNMLDSKWALQVGDRATELARMMETGEYGGLQRV